MPVISDRIGIEDIAGITRAHTHTHTHTHTHLEDDLAHELGGGGQLFGHVLYGLGEQLVLAHVGEDASHLFLLLHRAVLLNGQDHRVPGGGGRHPAP